MSVAGASALVPSDAEGLQQTVGQVMGVSGDEVRNGQFLPVGDRQVDFA